MTFRGELYILSYSGALNVKNLPDFGPVHLQIGGYNVIVHPPIRIASATWRPIPQLHDGNIRRILPLPPDARLPLLRSAAFPAFDENEKPALEIHYSSPEGEADLSAPCDTLPVEVIGSQREFTRERVAKDVANVLMSWLRVLTLQWWVGQTGEAISGNLHVFFPLSSQSQVGGGPVPRCQQTTPGVQTMPCSPQIWTAACGNVSRDELPPRSKLFILDSEQFYFSGNYPVSIILLTSAYEILRDQILGSCMTKSALGKIGNDLSFHVKSVFERHLGRNMEKELPECYEFLRACWIARGHVAHGKELLWRWGGKESSFRDYPSNLFFRQARNVEAWFESVRG